MSGTTGFKWRLLVAVAVVLLVSWWAGVRAPGVSADSPPQQTFLVTVTPGTDGAQLAADYGAVLVGEVPALSVVALRGTADLAAALAADGRVVGVSQDVLLDSQPRYINFDGTPLEAQPRYINFDGGVPAEYTDQWADAAVRAEQAHTVATGQDVVVAVLDTGVDLDHPLLAGRLVPGYDFVDDDAVPEDLPNGVDQDGDGAVDEAAGHGTHVAGIVALVAPDAKIMPVRIFDSDGRGSYFDAIQGIVYAVDHGAKVINLSGHGPEDAPALKAAVEYAWSHGVVFAAAGGVNVLGYPALYDPVLSVGATDRYDNLTDFSTFQNGVADVYAPGREIFSAYYDSSYAVWSGNSMATPFVAGEAALLFSVPGCDAVCVVNTIRQHTRPVANQPQARRIDLYDAVAAAAGGSDVAVRVQYRRGDSSPSDAQIVPQVRLVNNGTTVPYSALRLRYWFTPEGDGQFVEVTDFAAPMEASAVTASFGTANGHHYLEVGFTDAAGLLYGGRVPEANEHVQLRFHNAAWINQDESNDYSFNETASSFVDWDRITVYYNGQLVWGVEPGQEATQTTATCTVTYSVRDDWGNGATVDVTVTNNTDTPVDGWTVQWTFPDAGQQVTALWNGSYTQNGQTVSVSNASWNGTIPAGGSVSFGFNMSYAGANPVPSGFTLNGAACQ